MTYEEEAIQAAEEFDAFNIKHIVHLAVSCKVPREELRDWMRAKKCEWPGCFKNHVCEGLLGPSDK